MKTAAPTNSEAYPPYALPLSGELPYKVSARPYQYRRRAAASGRRAVAWRAGGHWLTPPAIVDAPTFAARRQSVSLVRLGSCAACSAPFKPPRSLSVEVVAVHTNDDQPNVFARSRLLCLASFCRAALRRDSSRRC